MSETLQPENPSPQLHPHLRKLAPLAALAITTACNSSQTINNQENIICTSFTLVALLAIGAIALRQSYTNTHTHESYTDHYHAGDHPFDSEVEEQRLAKTHENELFRTRIRQINTSIAQRQKDNKARAEAQAAKEIEEQKIRDIKSRESREQLFDDIGEFIDNIW